MFAHFRARVSPRRHQRLLGLESLEDRAVPATGLVPDLSVSLTDASAFLPPEDLLVSSPDFVSASVQGSEFIDPSALECPPEMDGFPVDSLGSMTVVGDPFVVVPVFVDPFFGDTFVGDPIVVVPVFSDPFFTDPFFGDPFLSDPFFSDPFFSDPFFDVSVSLPEVSVSSPSNPLPGLSVNIGVPGGTEGGGVALPAGNAPLLADVLPVLDIPLPIGDGGPLTAANGLPLPVSEPGVNSPSVVPTTPDGRPAPGQGTEANLAAITQQALEAADGLSDVYLPGTREGEAVGLTLQTRTEATSADNPFALAATLMTDLPGEAFSGEEKADRVEVFNPFSTSEETPGTTRSQVTPSEQQETSPRTDADEGAQLDRLITGSEETLQRLGNGDAEAVPPSDEESGKNTSVAPSWLDRFLQLLNGTTTASEETQTRAAMPVDQSKIGTNEPLSSSWGGSTTVLAAIAAGIVVLPRDFSSRRSQVGLRKEDEMTR